MLLSAEDFNLVPYNIPNLVENYADTFPEFVTEHEGLVLNNILGRLLASKFLTDMELAAELQATRFKNLRDGVVYTHNGVRYKFDGLTKALKPYIYFKWTRENLDDDSGIGIVESTSENSTKVSPNPRLCRAFNDYSRKIGSCRKFEDTLYGLLYNSGETYLADIAEYEYTDIKVYLDDYFKYPGLMNQFGL